MHLSDKSFKTIPYLASKHKWDGAVGACYFTVAQHWRKAIQVFDAGRHSVPGHFNPSAIEVPAKCFHELCPLPALDMHPHLSARSVETATWCLHPVSPCQLSPPLFRPISSLDLTQLNRPDRLKRSGRKLYLRELWRSHAACRDQGVLRWEKEEEQEEG